MLLTIDLADSTGSRFAERFAHGRTETCHFSGGRVHMFLERTDNSACFTMLLESSPPDTSFNEENRDELRAGAQTYASGTLLSNALAEVLAPLVDLADAGLVNHLETCQIVRAHVAVLPSSDGIISFQKLFEPLGYNFRVTTHALSERLPEWGANSYYSLTLSGRLSLRDLIIHLRVLGPLFDETSVGKLNEQGSAQLLRSSQTWLANHPERSGIERSHGRRGSSDKYHLQRFEAVYAALKYYGARRVLDLGCGTGEWIRYLLPDSQFEEIVGVEVSLEALRSARAQVPIRDISRVRLLHGALTYWDERLIGFDAAAVVEVIEHLDRSQLDAFEKVLWHLARPGLIAVTTPNAEYNRLHLWHKSGRLRHPDHRFEWTRAEFESWSKEVAGRNGYDVTFASVGPSDSRVGALTQIALFRRRSTQLLAVIPVEETHTAEPYYSLPALTDVVGERAIARS
ncbi:MAG: methyltransferase domain-containing protein, partial [Gemmatimonadota bacterium]